MPAIKPWELHGSSSATSSKCASRLLAGLKPKKKQPNPFLFYKMKSQLVLNQACKLPEMPNPSLFGGRCLLLNISRGLNLIPRQSLLQPLDFPKPLRFLCVRCQLHLHRRQVLFFGKHLLPNGGVHPASPREPQGRLMCLLFQEQLASPCASHQPQ
jgi:hypothetical protein